MKSITLYSNNSTLSKGLKKKLDAADIDYEIERDDEIIKEMGIVDIPVLEVDSKMMNYKKAINWINERKDD